MISWVQSSELGRSGVGLEVGLPTSPRGGLQPACNLSWDPSLWHWSLLHARGVFKGAVSCVKPLLINELTGETEKTDRCKVIPVFTPNSRAVQ